MEYSDRTLVKLIGKLLAENYLTVSTAESCTGGQLGAVLTSEPGSSNWFAGGVIAYANNAKTSLLEVPSEIIDKFGAVSEQVTESMVQGIRKIMGTDFSVAVSGIAGPAGGTSEKPVGTVCMSVLGKTSSAIETKTFSGTREVVRKAAVSYLLSMLYSRILEEGE